MCPSWTRHCMPQLSPRARLLSFLLVLASLFAPGQLSYLPYLAPEGEASDAAANVTLDTGAVRQRTEHLARLGIERWQTAGHRGQGIKVAILDSGFRGYRSHLGLALPPSVQTRSFRFDGNLEARDSQHGILCGEVVHAVAPAAELLFANWESDSPEQFLRAVEWARDQGARVICCSVIMPNWSDGEGGGAIHEALQRILDSGKNAAGVLFFASAGNTAERHWTGTFQDTPGHYHAWKSGQIDNALTPWGDEPVSVELYGQPGADYEVTVLDRTTGREVGRATASSQGQRCCGVVRFPSEAGHAYQARVRLSRGTAGRFHLVALHSGLEYITSRGSICFPADGPEIVAVGAVDSQGHRLSYSSCGPNSVQPKPDVVAPVPFASLWRARPFSGTSAAAPQVGGVAALWWSRHPAWTAEQIRTALRTSARDLYEPGHDCQTGYGLVTLP